MACFTRGRGSHIHFQVVTSLTLPVMYLWEGFQASSCGSLCYSFQVVGGITDCIHTFPGSLPRMKSTLPHKLAQLYWYSKNYVPPSTPMLKSTTPYTYPNMVRFGNPSQRAYPAVCLSSNAPSAQSTRVRSGSMQDYKELLLSSRTFHFQRHSLVACTCDSLYGCLRIM